MTAGTDIYAALIEVQKEIENPQNTATNPFFKSKYAPLPEILNYVRPILNKHGLLLIQDTGSCEGNTPFVRTSIVHVETGESLRTEKLGSPLKKKEAQGVGASITYLRRFQLVSLLAISGEDDLDGEQGISSNNKKSTDNKPKGKPKPSTNKPTPKNKPKATDEEAAGEVDADFRKNKPKKPTKVNVKASKKTEEAETVNMAPIDLKPLRSINPELDIWINFNEDTPTTQSQVIEACQDLLGEDKITKAEVNKVRKALGVQT
jgi:hypothetical protein